MVNPKESIARVKPRNRIGSIIFLACRDAIGISLKRLVFLFDLGRGLGSTLEKIPSMECLKRNNLEQLRSIFLHKILFR